MKTEGLTLFWWHPSNKSSFSPVVAGFRPWLASFLRIQSQTCVFCGGWGLKKKNSPKIEISLTLEEFIGRTGARLTPFTSPSNPDFWNSSRFDRYIDALPAVLTATSMAELWFHKEKIVELFKKTVTDSPEYISAFFYLLTRFPENATTLDAKQVIPIQQPLHPLLSSITNTRLSVRVPGGHVPRDRGVLASHHPYLQVGLNTGPSRDMTMFPSIPSRF